jgi:hypothetical protein
MSGVGNYPSKTRNGADYGKFYDDSGKGGIEFGMSKAKAAEFAPKPEPAPPTGQPRWTGMRGGIKSKKTGKEPTRVQPPRERGSKKYGPSVEDRNAKYLASLKKGSGGRRTRKHRRNTRRR